MSHQKGTLWLGSQTFAFLGRDMFRDTAARLENIMFTDRRQMDSTAVDVGVGRNGHRRLQDQERSRISTFGGLKTKPWH